MLLPLLLGCLSQGLGANSQPPKIIDDSPLPGLPVSEVCQRISNPSVPETNAYYILQPGDDSWQTISRRFRPRTIDGKRLESPDPQTFIDANLILYQDLEVNPAYFYEKWFQPGNPIYLPAGLTCYDYSTRSQPELQPVAELVPDGHPQRPRR